MLLCILGDGGGGGSHEGSGGQAGSGRSGVGRIRQKGLAGVGRALIKPPVVASPQDGPSDPRRLLENLNW